MIELGVCSPFGDRHPRTARPQDSHGARNQKGSLRSETVIRGILEVSSSATVFGSARSHGEAIKQTPHSLNLK